MYALYYTCGLLRLAHSLHVRTLLDSKLRPNCSNNSPDGQSRLSRYVFKCWPCHLQWTVGYITSDRPYIQSYQVSPGPAHHARVDQCRPL